MKVRQPRGVLVAVLSLALITAACSKSNNGGASTGSTGSSGSTGSTGSTGSAGGSGSASISIKNFAFNPNALTVSSGSTDITIINNDTHLHTFTLDDGSVNVSIPPGQTKTVTVDITQTTGWHCTIHPTMTGTLTVA